MLAKIPMELLVQVIGNIPYRADLHSLCLVCKRLCDATLPVLYEDLTVVVAGSLENGELARMIALLEQLPLRHLKDTKHICLLNLTGRNNPCLHKWNSSKEALVKVDDLYRRLMRVLRFLLSAIPRNRLRSFRWDMGACFPQDMLCSENGLTRNQQCIETLYFHTELYCTKNEEADYPVDASRLQNLRSLTWRGPCREKDYRLIYKCLHSSNVTALNLELCRFDIVVTSFFDIRLPMIKVRDTFLIRDVLGVQSGGKQPLLCLESLSIGPMSFCGMEADIVSALTLGRLRSLKLHNCDSSPALMEALIKSTQPLGLTSFEITLDPYRTSYRFRELTSVPATLTKFLRACQSLEKLYILLPQSFLASISGDAIMKHYPTLRRLIIHGIVKRGNEGAYDVEIPDNLFQFLLTGSPVKSIGVSMQLRVTIETWKKLSPRPSCKMLHLRGMPYNIGIYMSHEEDAANGSYDRSVLATMESLDQLTDPTTLSLFEFADWAFGDDGLPELQILAWGLFSPGDTFCNQNLVFCRSENGYKPLARTDVLAWDIFQENLDMLVSSYEN